jgi:hypothetical protein
MRLTGLLYSILVLKFLLSSVIPVEADGGANQHFESEEPDSTWSNCTVNGRHPGYSATRYLDFNWQYSWVQWDLDILSTGNYYEVTIRYSAEKPYPAMLLVDGTAVGEFSLSETGDWSTWNTKMLVSSLVKGQHKIQLAAFNSIGPYVDWISIQPRQLPKLVVVSLSNANHAMKMATLRSLGSNLVEVA